MKEAGPGLLAQFVALLGGALAYAAHLLVGSAVVPLACRAGTSWPIHLTTIVAVVVIMLAALLASRVQASAREAGSQHGVFLGRAGLLLDAWFLVIVLFAELPALFMDPCLP